MNSNQKIKVYTGLVLAMLFWSLSFIWYKEVYKFLPPITTIFFRLIISTSLLFIYALIVGRFQKIKKEDMKSLILLTFFQPFLYFVGEGLGMQYVSSTIGAVIIATIPIFAPIAAYYYFNERLSWANISGFVISLLGVVFVVYKTNSKIEASAAGIALLFLAVFAAIMYSVIILRLAKKYSPLSITIYQNGIGVLFFLPLVFLVEYDEIINIEFSTEMLIPLFELSIFSSSFAFILFVESIRRIGISKANIFSNLIPVFTAILSFYILGESFEIQNIIGIALVVFGLFFAQKGTRVRNV